MFTECKKSGWLSLSLSNSLCIAYIILYLIRICNTLSTASFKYSAWFSGDFFSRFFSFLLILTLLKQMRCVGLLLMMVEMTPCWSSCRGLNALWTPEASAKSRGPVGPQLSPKFNRIIVLYISCIGHRRSNNILSSWKFCSLKNIHGGAKLRVVYETILCSIN